MPQEMFIVSRERPELFAYLTQTFSEAETVKVIWDRRSGERRRAARPDVPERRQGDRRNHTRVDAELRAVGYAFLGA